MRSLSPLLQKSSTQLCLTGFHEFMESFCLNFFTGCIACQSCFGFELLSTLKDLFEDYIFSKMVALALAAIAGGNEFVQ